MGLAVLLPPLFVTVSSVSLIMPTSTALALSAHQSRAGAASGLLGLAQFGIGGTIAPLISADGATAILMTASMAGAVLGALVVRLLVARLDRVTPVLSTAPAATSGMP